MSLRPGISDQTLERLEIRHVTAPEAKVLTGLAEPGIYIPFKGVNCPGGPYGRLRLDLPIGDMKYHQRRGSRVHNYVQEGLTLHNGDLILIEGEFKAISLTEAGFPAVGTSGFYSWGKKIKIIQGLPLEDRDETDVVKSGDETPTTLVIHREIQQLLTNLSPRRVVFVCDPDAVLNLSFSDAMNKLAALIPCPLAMVRIPYDAPHGKGMDDIRENMGQEAFASWFQQALAGAILVPRVTKPECITASLIERERLTFAGLVGERREIAKVQLAKLHASISRKRSTEAEALAQTLQQLARDTFQFPLENLN